MAFSLHSSDGVISREEKTQIRKRRRARARKGKTLLRTSGRILAMPFKAIAYVVAFGVAPIINLVGGEDLYENEALLRRD